MKHSHSSCCTGVGVRRFLAQVCVVLSAALSANAVAKGDIVAAASDLKFALEEVHAKFQKDQKQSVRLVFGSSGLLYQQMVNGAPFGMLLSADEQYAILLDHAGLTAHAGALYAIGRIVLIQKRDGSADLSIDKDRLRSAIQAAKKIAIANPQHAPYGKAAKEFLESMGLWKEAQSKLVYGENITQATSFVLAGGADFGISALSLALAPVISKQSQYTLIPEQYHGTLRQRMALSKHAPPVVVDFYAYLKTKPARDVLNRYGFTLPE